VQTGYEKNQKHRNPFTAHSSVTVVAHNILAFRNIVIRACIYFYFYVASLSFSLSLLTLNNCSDVCVCDMLTHIRVNLSLMLSVTTDSYVKIMRHTRAIGTEE
jgi:hypothetical protein